MGSTGYVTEVALADTVDVVTEVAPADALDVGPDGTLKPIKVEVEPLFLPLVLGFPAAFG